MKRKNRIFIFNQVLRLTGVIVSVDAVTACVECFFMAVILEGSCYQIIKSCLVKFGYRVITAFDLTYFYRRTQKLNEVALIAN
jgi:dolichyl-phosphate-mannose--protein O-mannosyl transferase